MSMPGVLTEKITVLTLWAVMNSWLMVGFHVGLFQPPGFWLASMAGFGVSGGLSDV